jgi:hypothetical protein
VRWRWARLRAAWPGGLESVQGACRKSAGNINKIGSDFAVRKSWQRRESIGCRTLPEKIPGVSRGAMDWRILSAGNCRLLVILQSKLADANLHQIRTSPAPRFGVDLPGSCPRRAPLRSGMRPFAHLCIPLHIDTGSITSILGDSLGTAWVPKLFHLAAHVGRQSPSQTCPLEVSFAYARWSPSTAASTSRSPSPPCPDGGRRRLVCFQDLGRLAKYSRGQRGVSSQR